MIAGFLDLLGWGQLTAAEQAGALGGACLGLAAWLLALGRVRRQETAMILAAWLLSLPFRLLAALGLRRSLILACLFVLAVTAYGAAEDLGLIDPPAQAAPAPKPAAGQPGPSRAAVADIPPGYLRLYRQAGARYRIPWSVLAAIGKVESDHGRARLPGGAVGQQLGRGLWTHADRLCTRQQGRQRLGPLRPRPPPQPGPGDPGRGPLSGRPRRPPPPRPGPVRLQPLLGLRDPGQAARPPLRQRE